MVQKDNLNIEIFEKLIKREDGLGDFLSNLPSLDEVAQREMCRVFEIMNDVGPLDYSSIYDYCYLFSDIRKTTALVDEEGELLLSERTNNFYINPRHSILINKTNRLSRLRKELGMAPLFRKSQKKVQTLNDLIK